MATSNLDTAATCGAVIRSGEGQILRWGQGGKVRIIAGAASTDMCFSIAEVTDAPGTGAPLHVHHSEAEGFYILDGTVQLTCGSEEIVAQTGDFVYAPKNVPHKYVVTGDKPARLLLLFSRPGFERFFSEGGTPLDQLSAGPPDANAFRKLVEKYDMELLESAPCH